MTGGFLGILIGLTLGLTGAGGGILAVPALVLGLGMDMPQAAPVALMAVGLAAAVGSAEGLRRGTVRYKAAALMSIVGGLAAPWGAQLARLAPGPWLSGLFAMVMLLVAGRMLRQSLAAPAGAQAQAERPCHISPQTGKFVWTPRAAATLGGIGAISGLFTGLLGVGGGFIIVPALRQFSDAPMHAIVSTSLMVIALISAVTVGHAVADGLTLDAAAWTFVAAAVLGMVLGRALAPRLPTARLQQLFALVCVVVAGVLLWRTGWQA
ncbi:sulfite exporter TauE/SafE [Bordetella bronchiseptica MBORD678]|uniref:sulfite exporter TauE/SafE family protein n=1 Tax=Bordetella bronchiseptica TaxID=518 RepID=UPI00049EE27E|nr:sulfite exporter TauE/SafE family protein [Bordetella bronchiseptica]KDD88771.1 sulfite exporter TauE/SafE [Bordetella bronchiseptica MBORD678]